MDRDMFYQNVNQGFVSPGTYIPPSGYNMSSQYQVYGSNSAYNPNNIPNNIYNNPNTVIENNYEDRIYKLERIVKNLDTRLQKLENSDTQTNENFYTI